MSGILLGLDVGEARIGLARADADLGMAFGRGALRRGALAEDVRAIVQLAAAEGAQRVVVGLPLHSSGGETPQAGRVRAFAEALRAAGLEIVFQDERFSTQWAERRLRGGTAPQRKRRDKGRVDEASAVTILETYLRHPAAPEGAPPR